MRIALVQNHPAFGDKKGNVASLIAQMDSAEEASSTTPPWH
jgi:predicted amidohydrolase